MKTPFLWLLLITFPLISCRVSLKVSPSGNKTGTAGSAFFQQASSRNVEQREKLAAKLLLEGNFPPFLRHFRSVHVAINDSISGKRISARFFVAPDYLSIGTRRDWARIPLTPMTAQTIADRWNCFLPTRKMVDDIYRQSRVRLQPVPLFAFRDSTPTFWHHHLIIEGQRQGRLGLIAGIKKDIVISGKINGDHRPNRVAIYGWHRSDGQPIQPLYTGHINTYVDYSHGIRLAWRKIRVQIPGIQKSRWIDYTEVLADPRLRPLLCDEKDCSYFAYPVHNEPDAGRQ